MSVERSLIEAVDSLGRVELSLAEAEGLVALLGEYRTVARGRAALCRETGHAADEIAWRERELTVLDAIERLESLTLRELGTGNGERRDGELPHGEPGTADGERGSDGGGG